MNKKRVGPKPVRPVKNNGVRYEALHWGKTRDLMQNGGYIIAFDDRSDEELWTLKVYDVFYNTDIESDKQDVFITSLRFGWFSKNYLIVENEKKETFKIDLTTKAVEKS